MIWQISGGFTIYLSSSCVITIRISNSCKYTGVNREALHRLWKAIFFFTARHTRICISTMYKSRKNPGTMSSAWYAWMCNKIKGWYVSRKYITFCCFWHCYLCCALLTVQTATKLRWRGNHPCHGISCLHWYCCVDSLLHSFSSTVGVLPGSYHWNAFIHLAKSRIHQ